MISSCCISPLISPFSMRSVSYRKKIGDFFIFLSITSNLTTRRSQDSSVRIIIMLRNESPWNRGSIPGNGRNVSPFHSVQVGSGEKPISLATSLGCSMFTSLFPSQENSTIRKEIAVNIRCQCTVRSDKGVEKGIKLPQNTTFTQNRSQSVLAWKLSPLLSWNLRNTLLRKLFFTSHFLFRGINDLCVYNRLSQKIRRNTLVFISFPSLQETAAGSISPNKRSYVFDGLSLLTDFKFIVFLLASAVFS